MRELIFQGRDAFLEYVGEGTQTAVAFFAILFLLYLIFFTKKIRQNKKITIFTEIAGLLIFALVSPFISTFVNGLNTTNDDTHLYNMLPNAAITAIAITVFISLYFKDNHSRLRIYGVTFAVIAVFVIGLTQPWKLTTDNYSIISNKNKILSDVTEMKEVVGEASVIMPQRLMAQAGEVSPYTEYIEGPGTIIDESDAKEMAKSGLENNCTYVILDKKELPEDNLENLDSIMAEYNYVIDCEKSRYIYYKQGITWELTEYNDESGAQGLFYTLYNRADGTLIVIDGGHEENADNVRSVIMSYGGVVDAWFLTHFHEDHIGAFNSIYENLQEIEIKDIYVSEFDNHYDTFLDVYQYWDDPGTFAKYMENTKNAENVHHPARGEEIDISNIHIKNYNTYDDTLLQLDTNDLPNNCGLVLKFSASKDTILFMGDMYSPAVGQYIIDTYGEEIRAEYINACHHGNSIMPTSFYQFVTPSIMFFDGPEWLVTSDDYRAKELMEWCDIMGITHYDHRTAPNVFYFW